MDPRLWLGPAIVAAIISSLVTIGGWFVSHSRDRRTEAARRVERIQNIQTGLLADVRSYRHRFAATDFEAHLKGVVEQIERGSGEPSYTPFVTREPESLLWTAVTAEVHVLPTEVIDPVVVFFTQIATIRGLIEDLRSDRYWSLERARKIAMYADYIELRKYSVQLADEAERALRSALGLPWSSSSEPGPSGRKSASAGSAASEAVERS